MNPRIFPLIDVDSHLSALDSGEWGELEQIVERFETAWRSGATPVLKEYLPIHGPSRSVVLRELAATDLEWRIRRGLGAAVEGYLSDFPELGDSPPTIVQLATSEFIARQRAGFAVDAAEFAQRFPGIGDALRSRLAELMVTESLASLRSSESGSNRDSATDAQGGDPNDSPRSETGDFAAEAPRCVGRYDLVRRIGGGSFGTVYEAVDSELGRRVAVKLPRHSLSARSDERARFVREAQNLARLSHPNIVPVLDAGSSEGTFYFVCALVDGPTFADRLRDGPLEPRVAASIVATIAGALDHAHRQGIVHRDVKPTNVLFDTSGSPWLTDFGLAICSDAESTLTLEGQLLGTPAYMAPEQATGAAHRVDGRSDVYSLGAVLYESLTGQPPFVGSPSAVLEQIRICEPLPPTRICPRIDRDLEMICLKALEKYPVDRYASAADFADDLRRYLADEPIRARQPGTARRLVKWARRRPAAAALSGVTLAAVLSVTVLVWLHNVQLRRALIQTDQARQLAEDLRLTGEQSQRQTENLLYAADMRLATTAHANGDRNETMARLRKYLPDGSKPDRRDFAWRRLWSLCHADQQTLVGHAGDVYAVQVMSGGRQLVSAGLDGTLRMWTLSKDARPKILAQHANEVAFAALSQAGTTLAAGGDEGMIRIWDLVLQQETRQFAGHADSVLCGAISPRGDQLATAGRDKVIRLWALPIGEPVAELVGHTSSVESLAYLPDGNAIASTGADRTLRLWDLAAKSGTILATHPLPTYCVACSHDGRSLASGCVDHDIYVWDVETRGLLGRLDGHTEIVQSLAFSPDDTRVASAGRDGTVRVWDLATLTQSESFMSHSSRVWNVAWFPDGATLASAGGDGTIRIWQCGTSRLERVVSVPTEVRRVCLSSSEHRWWLAARKQEVWTIDADGAPAALTTPIPSGRYVVVARDANVLAVMTGNHDVRLYDGSGKPASESVKLPMHIGQAALSHAGDLLAITSSEAELYLYELPTFHLRWSREVHGPGAPAVSFTPQGDGLLVAGAESSIAIYDVAEGTTRLATKTRQCIRVAMSPSGRSLAAGCSDRAIRILDAENGIEQACLQGHDGAVGSLAFSPDGQTLAAGTSNGSVTLWHVPSWQESGGFKTSLAAVNDLSFSADGNTLAIGGRTASDGGQVTLWETKTVAD